MVIVHQHTLLLPVAYLQTNNTECCVRWYGDVSYPFLLAVKEQSVVQEGF